MTFQRQLNRLRKICLAYPESAEVEAWGHPTFRAGKKIFASFGTYQDRPSTTVKSTLEEQSMLVQDDSFFVPHYVGHKGWVGIWLDTNVSWDLVAELIEASYRAVALKRMLKPLDGG